MARAIMMVYNDKKDCIDFFKVYDEESKICYAMPTDAKEWYKNHIKEQKSLINKI